MKSTAGIALFIFSLLWMGTWRSLQAQQNDTVKDKDIRVVDFVDLEYPPLARTAHLQGVVVVRATLDDHGKVVDAVAISGQDVLIPACLANVKRWRFRPNTENAAVIVYNFRMIEGSSKSGASQFIFQGPNFATITAGLPTIEP
jgi:TonB family protein